MSKNISISLERHFEDFINQKIKSESFSSVSEVVQAGLKLLEERDQKIEALRQALVEGEESEILESYDPAEHLAELHRNYKKL